eukprot:6673301-Alexandrium_andersonii.AAC.1
MSGGESVAQFAAGVADASAGGPAGSEAPPAAPAQPKAGGFARLTSGHRGTIEIGETDEGAEGPP